MEEKPILKKVCMLGSFAVGKTSLVRRFVKSIFDERYLATLGVKTDKKVIDVDGRKVAMVLWDIAGSEEYFKVPLSYVRGASGYLLVIDGTRPQTVDSGCELAEEIEGELGRIPRVAVLNKIDLQDEWKLTDELLQPVQALGCPLIRSSARTGQGVQEVFLSLARRLL